MSKNFAIDLKININGNYSKEIKNITKNTEKATRAINKTNYSTNKISNSIARSTQKTKRWNSIIKKTTASMIKIKAVGTAMKANFLKGSLILGGLGGLMKFGEKYQENWVHIGNVFSMSAEKAKQKWGQALKEISKESGKSITEIQDALYQAGSAGVGQKNVADFTRNSVKIMAIGKAEANETVKLITSIMDAYPNLQRDYNKIGNLLVTSQNLGKLTVGDMGGLGSVMGTAQSMGVSFKELLGALTGISKLTTTDKGITNLKGILSSVAGQSEQAKKELKRLGITFNVTTLAEKGLSNASKDLLTQLRAKTKGAVEFNASLKKILPNQRGREGIVLLANNKALQISNKFVKQFNNNIDSTSKSFKEYKKAKAFSIMTNNLKLLILELSEGLLPILNPIISKLIKVVGVAGKWIKENKTLVKWIGLIVAGLGAYLIINGAVGYAIVFVTKVVLTLIAVGETLFDVLALLAANPLVLALSVLAIIIGFLIYKFVVFYKKVGSIKKAFQQLGSYIKGIFTGVIKSVTGLWDSFLNKIGLGKTKTAEAVSGFDAYLPKNNLELSSVRKGINTAGGAQGNKINNNNNINVVVNANTNANPTAIGKLTASQIKKAMMEKMDIAKSMKMRIQGVTQ